MATPRISRYYSIIGHTPDDVELRYGVWNAVSLTLTDETKSGHLFSVLSLLDGSLPVADIARRVGIDRDDVEGVLDQLRELGALEETGPRTALDYYLDTITPGLKSLDGLSENRPQSINVMGDDPETLQQICNYLSGSLPIDVELHLVPQEHKLLRIILDADRSWLMDGFTFHDRLQLFDEWKGSLMIFSMKNINPRAFQVMNRVALHLGIPWLHAALDGPFVLVGPLFVPGRSSCYECFETRIAMNLREQANYQRYKNALVEGRVRKAALPIYPALVGLLAAHVAMETLNYIYTGSSFCIQKVMAVYLPTMEFVFNDVLRLPACASCGSHSERDDKELFFGFEMLAQPQTPT